MGYAEDIAAMPDTIQQRVDELAEELRQRITAPDYVSDMHELLGGQVFHLLFGGIVEEERVFPVNAAEWLTLRGMDRFEGLLKDHCEDRLDAGMYEDPRDGMGAAVSATVADIVAWRAIELNGGVDTPLATTHSTGRPATETIYTPQDG